MSAPPLTFGSVMRAFRADVRATVRDHGKHTSSAHKRAVLFIILVGIVLRASLLNRPISYDEASAFVQFGTLSFIGLISDYSDPSNHVFHTLLTKLSTGLFGIGVIPLRLPAFIAGVLVMPLFYLFVRGMFNRYIALMALALVAASGPLVEYSAIARGYSITWLCTMVALVLGRHLIKENNPVSAVLIGLACAFGMWVVPAMAHIGLFIYVWLLFSLTAKYDNTLRERLMLLLLSLVVCIGLVILLYMPVILTHGFDQLISHRAVPDQGWDAFTVKYQDGGFALWAYIVDSSASWVAILGFGGLLHAAFISSKFRFLAFAMLVGAVPLVIARTVVEPPAAWIYTLFLFHLSSAIALFYLLKFFQEKVFTGLGKRSRSAVAALVLLIAFGIPGWYMARERTAGMPEAQWTANYAKEVLKTGDKLYSDHPWDRPIAFAIRAEGLDPSILSGAPAHGGRAILAVDPAKEQTQRSILRHNGQLPEKWDEAIMVQDWPGMKIFAARLREDATSGDVR